MTIPSSSDPAEIVIPLHVEDVSVGRRKIAQDVRVNIRTLAHQHLIDETLAHENVEIERVAIGRPVKAVPAVRDDGDTMIIPVVEEVLVVERRLILKEEIRLRRVRTTEQHRQTVTLREQHVGIERAQPGDRKSIPPSEVAPIPKHQTVKQMADQPIVSGGEAAILHSGNASTQRAPLAAGTAITDADFADRTIEVEETHEQIVVAKTARLKEEVVVKKATIDRVETIQDTTRRQEVEITRDDQPLGTSGTTAKPSPVTRSGV